MDKKAPKPVSFFNLLCRLGLFSLALLPIILWKPYPARAAVVQDAVFFTDLNEHWARSHITRLATLDMVKGNPDHTFKPDKQISRLETVVLLMRAGGFTAEAERQASAGSTAKRGAGASPSTTPRVPWGQQYLDLAVGKGFLSLDNMNDFDFDAPASRLEVAKLLAHILYLLPPAAESDSQQVEKGLPEGTGFAADKAFSDEALVQPGDQYCIRAVAAAGIMSGYADGTFRPLDFLTRAEMAVILSRLVDQGWVKTADGRCFTGWISGINTQKGSKELELTTPDGVKKFKAAQGVYCYKDGEEWPFEQAVDYRGEVILNGSKQVSWVNLFQRKDSAQNLEKIRGSVKSVALGKENLLVISDLNCQDRILLLDWDAVVVKKGALQKFASLKAGTFVDVETAQDQVKKVTVLEVKTVSGQVEKLDGRRLYLKGGLSGNKPGWFNYYDRARVVNKDGVGRGDVQAGEKVQITYLDPFPKEIDDEIPLEIKVQ